TSCWVTRVVTEYSTRGSWLENVKVNSFEGLKVKVSTSRSSTTPHAPFWKPFGTTSFCSFSGVMSRPQSTLASGVACASGVGGTLASSGAGGAASSTEPPAAAAGVFGGESAAGADPL